MRHLLILLFVALSTPAIGTPLFFEDFESDLSAWQGTGGSMTPDSGIIVLDPIQMDHALTFGSTNSAGDTFTTQDVFAGGTGSDYILSFDYLGTCGTGNCGGFIGYSDGLPGAHIWLGGTTTPYADILPDTGEWEHVSIAFTASYSTFSIMLEDWGGSPGGSGDAYFDNIMLTDANVPVPATLALFGLGLAGLGWSRRKTA